MGIDLDITEGKWEQEMYLDNRGTELDECQGLGPIWALSGDHGPFLSTHKDNAIATLCVPQFKVLADESDKLIDRLISEKSTLNVDGLLVSLMELKSRIKELKNDA